MLNNIYNNASIISISAFHFKNVLLQNSKDTPYSKITSFCLPGRCI
eukprot:UN24036